jgi:hypothetical protein
MKIVIVMILLLASCLVASAGPVAVGGDFGRTWISNFQAQNHKPVEQNNSTNLTSRGVVPKGKALVNGNLVDQQNATNPRNPSASWLGDTTVSGNPSSPMYGTFNGSMQASQFFNKGIIKPVHNIDATWNKTLQEPQPDANGLIHGWDAETYDAIGPALDYL